MTFVGAVPVKLVMAVVADSIVEDWLVCMPWVTSYQHKQESWFKPEQKHRGDIRPKEHSPFKPSKTRDFHRRHAEWIALVGILWLDKNWKNKVVAELLDSKHYQSTLEVKHRLKKLSQADAALLPADVADNVKALTGVAITTPVRVRMVDTLKRILTIP